MLPLSGERTNAKGIISEKLDSVDTIRGSSTLKRGFAHMQKNGVVMDVTNVEQALIAQEAGAVSVMVLDKLPSEVRKAGGVARTASIKIIEEIMDSVTIPVMAKCRIGHVNEALVLQETIDNKYYDELIPVTGDDGIYWAKELARKEGIITGVSGGATFAIAAKVAKKAKKGSKILCMLPDTAERYMSSILFDDIESEMTIEELDLLNSI